MKITIHQPNFNPYLGFFEKILYSDVFVVYDTAQYSKEGFQNRNYIKCNNVSTLLTLEVYGDSWHKQIKDVTLSNPKRLEKCWSSIKAAYSRTRYFKKYESDLEMIFKTPTDSLLEINMRLIRWILSLMNYNGQIIYSSELNLDLTRKKSDALYDIVTKLSGIEYISGSSGIHYLDETLFKQSNITVTYQSFEHPIYNQRGSEFIKNMGILDYIFNNAIEDLKFHNHFYRKEDFCKH